MTIPTVVQTSVGNTLRLGQQLGKGGEGAVFGIIDNADLAAKIYWPGKAAERHEKIRAMIAAGWHKSSPFIAFPADTLFAPKGEFVGFLMRKVGRHKPVHQLYSPASRKTEFVEAGFPFLVQAALNIARAIVKAHSTGCVIGDVNHSGILVSNEATTTLIDSDSFQITTPARTFLCQVGVPEFTPPELQGKRFDRIKRTPNHDAFGLAVLIFQLLFMGRHPFLGRFTGTGEMPPQRAIVEFRFAYSQHTTTTKMEPPPNAPLLNDFPEYISNAFEKSFGREGVNGSRPTAAEWVSLLERLRSELTICASNRAHHYYKGAPNCPWCRMELAVPGFVAFGSLQQINVIPTTVDLSHLIALISGIRDPGSTPDIKSIIVPINIKPSPSVAVARGRKWKQYGLGAGCAVAGLGLMIAGVPPLIGILVVGAGLGLAIRAAQEGNGLRMSRRNAEAAWNSARNTWDRQTSNGRFLEIKAEVTSQVNKLKSLPDEEKKRIQQLEHKKRDAQLARFLDKHHIAKAKISKISSTRKIALASYGIETAADIVRHRIEAIHGFGPTLAANLIAWRQTIERRFVYDPREPLNPTDVHAIRSDISRLRTDLEGRIRKSVATMQHVANETVEQRRRLTANVNASFQALKQAELDEEAFAKPISIDTAAAKKVAAVGIGIAMVAYIGLQVAKSPPRISRPFSPPVATRSTTTQQTPAPTVQPSPTPDPPVPRKGPEDANVPKEKGPTDTPPIPSPTENQTPTVPPPLDINPTPAPTPEPPVPADHPPQSALLDLAKANDARRVQQRLIELGYLEGLADGIWGPRSRRALQEFRAATGSGESESWDEQIHRKLFANSNVPSSATSRTFVGAWGANANQCRQIQRGLPGLTINERRAVAFGAVCEFNSIRREDANAWRVLATCSQGSDRWNADIRLSLSGNTLTWASERGTVTYQRCSGA